MARERERGPRDYIYRRGDVFWLRFQYPPALQESAKDFYSREEWPKEEARSLKTKDRQEAEALAASYIARHRALLIYHAARTSGEDCGSYEDFWEMQPNTQKPHPDGSRTVATETHIIFMPADGSTPQMRPNRIRRAVVLKPEFYQKHPEFKALAKHVEDTRKARNPDRDSDLIEDYIRVRGLDERKARGDGALLREGLRLFREVNGGKQIVASKRSDVKRLIDAEMERRGPNGGERVKKMISLLRSTVNWHMEDADHSMFEANIFANHEIATNDVKRPPYTEADIRTIKEHWHRFTDEEKLMMAWHFASSVRPVGLDSIRQDEWIEEDEYNDKGELVRTHHTRSVQIESDKDPNGQDYGRRKLPIPQTVLDLKREDGAPILPERINGPLFTTPRDQLLVEINRKLYEIGVNTDDVQDATGKTIQKGKSLYSARHRARDRFRVIKCPEEMSRAIMGHARDRKDSHGSYGHGFSMWELKPVMDRIRF
jgi:hypothetical protein